MAMDELKGCCVACKSTGDRTELTVREAMFGTGEEFCYLLCATCRSAQISEVPSDLERYYGSDYYSYNVRGSRATRPPYNGRIGRVAGAVFDQWYKVSGRGPGVKWARTAEMRRNDRILDIGCGSGANLLKLRSYGYKSLAGADPFLDADREPVRGLRLSKASHEELSGTYEWILMHHTLEHVPDPRAMLRSARRLLVDEGGVLLRLPLHGGWASRHYGTNWVQWDAPRHLILFSLDGLRLLANESGFDVSAVEYDSTAFQFWGSELTRDGVPHRNGPTGHFSAKEIARWEDAARRLNAALDGDQATVVLRCINTF